MLSKLKPTITTELHDEALLFGKNNDARAKEINIELPSPILVGEVWCENIYLTGNQLSSEEFKTLANAKFNIVIATFNQDFDRDDRKFTPNKVMLITETDFKWFDYLAESDRVKDVVYQIFNAPVIPDDVTYLPSPTYSHCSDSNKLKKVWAFSHQIETLEKGRFGDFKPTGPCPLGSSYQSNKHKLVFGFSSIRVRQMKKNFSPLDL